MRARRLQVWTGYRRSEKGWDLGHIGDVAAGSISAQGQPIDTLHGSFMLSQTPRQPCTCSPGVEALFGACSAPSGSIGASMPSERCAAVLRCCGAAVLR